VYVCILGCSAAVAGFAFVGPAAYVEVSVVEVVVSAGLEKMVVILVPGVFAVLAVADEDVVAVVSVGALRHWKA